MKVTIYTLTSDSDYGTSTEVFGTRVAMLNARQKEIASYMPRWLESWPVPVEGNMTCDELEAALDAAWQELASKTGFLDALASEKHELEIELSKDARDFICQMADFKPYRWKESESWTDDQAEDALTTMNAMIAKARRVQL